MKNTKSAKNQHERTNKNSSHLENALLELWSVRNPHIEATPQLLAKFKKKVTRTSYRKEVNTPFYNILSRKACFELTTARNRNLITIDEQNQLRRTVVGVFGLSVGSHIAPTWMLESRADSIKICDPDTITATNLNRIRFGWSAMGQKKCDIVKRDLSDINPLANIYASNKTDEISVEKMYKTTPPMNIVIDEIDSFEKKLLLRRLAKKYRIPLLSAADIGDNVMVDIERYDRDPQPEYFLGKIPNVEKINFSQISSAEKKKFIIKHIGFEAYSERMVDSLFAIGGSVPTWPQLGATATVAGGVLATLIKKIVLGERVESGRYYISLDDTFVSDFHEPEQEEVRKRKIEDFKTVLERKTNEA